MRNTVSFVLASMVLIWLLLPATALADDYDTAFDVDVDEKADMEAGAAMSTEDLYEDEAVTRAEFAAMLVALVFAIQESARELADRDYESEQ